MLLSKILNDLAIDTPVKILNEVEFDTLGIVASKIDKSMITFIESEKYIKDIPVNASMVITTAALEEKIEGCGLCITENPKLFFFKLHNAMQGYPEYIRKSHKTSIGENCKISNMSYIAENNVVIGNNVIIEEFVSIKENTIIGDNVVIAAGAVIGGEGFEAKRGYNVETIPITHLGGVRIDNHARVKHNTCVDKGLYPWDDTVIDAYALVDNLVHVAHGCKIGRGALIVAGSILGGRCVVGDRAWLSINAMTIPGITMEDDCYIGMGAVVLNNVPAQAVVTGVPAKRIEDIRADNAAIRKLISSCNQE